MFVCLLSRSCDLGPRAQKYFVHRNLRTKPFLRGGSEWFDTSPIGIEKAREIIEENLKKEEGSYKADETEKFKKLGDFWFGQTHKRNKKEDLR